MHGKSVKVWKSNRVTRYYPPPAPQLTEREGMTEKGRTRGRGRKREDILRGKAVIYERAASNKQGGGGGHSSSNKTKRRRGRQKFKEGATAEERKSWREVRAR